MRIGEVATAAGVSTRALRYYEEQGLLHPVRSPSGQRHYADSAVARVQWIQALYAAGLGSRSIVEFLPCIETGVPTPAMLHRLSDERERIDAQVRDLTASRDRLDGVIDAARGLAEDPDHVCTSVARV